MFGDPGTVAAHLIRSPVVRKVSFTGPTVVGKQIAALASEGVKPCILELGGHTPVLVFDDVDIELVAQQAVASKFHNGGQSCGSPSRFFVHESVHDHFVDAFVRYAEKLRVGDPLEEGTDIGPLANGRRRTAVQDLVTDAVAQGAELALGGTAIGGRGYYFAPTVLARVPESARVMNDEPFGPIAATATFSTAEQAVEQANRLPYGLGSYVWTADRARANVVSRLIEAGMVGINRFGLGGPDTFFGGVKESGYGSEGGPEAVQDYQVRKLDRPRMTPRPAAAYLLGRDAWELVYGPAQRAAISVLTRIQDHPLDPAAHVASDELQDVEVALSGWGAPVFDAALLDRMPRLRAILYAAGTVAGIVRPEVGRRGIVVSTAVSGNSVPVADFTVAAIHFSLKRLWPVLRGVATEIDVAAAPGGFRSTVGFVALGTVGRLVAARLATSDLQLLAYDPALRAGSAAALGLRLVTLEELFARCDVVSLHVPLLPSTRGLVTARLVASMKPNATLINTARGAILEPAVVSVLSQRPDLQAVLDVTDPEPLPAGSLLRSLPNVTLTPHVAGSVGRECRRLGDMMVDELRRFVAGQPLQWPVDLAHLERQGLAT